MPRTARRPAPTFHAVEEVRERMAELHAEYPQRNFPEAVRDERNELARIENEFVLRDQFVREQRKNPKAVEAGTDMTRHAAPTPRTQPIGPGSHGDPRREAMRTVDRCVNEGVMSTEAADRVDGVLQRDADQATNARWAPTAHPPAPAPGSG